MNRIGVALAYGFVGAFSVLAMRNLLEPHSTTWGGMVASGIWLFLVSLMLCIACVKDGLRPFLINRIGDFSRRKFAAIQSDHDGLPVVCFGFQLMHRRFHSLKIDLIRITSIEWNTGQGTALAGKDMDDWAVALWYDDPHALRKSLIRFERTPQEIYIVGRAGPRKEIQEFGLQFVGFLRRAGASLIDNGDGRKFLRAEEGANPDSVITP